MIRILLIVRLLLLCFSSTCVAEDGFVELFDIEGENIRTTHKSVFCRNFNGAYCVWFDVELEKQVADFIIHIRSKGTKNERVTLFDAFLLPTPLSFDESRSGFSFYFLKESGLLPYATFKINDIDYRLHFFREGVPEGAK